MADRPLEYLKLDQEDLDVICWLYDQNPALLKGTLAFYERKYFERGVTLDVEKLYADLVKHLSDEDK